MSESVFTQTFFNMIDVTYIENESSATSRRPKDLWEKLKEGLHDILFEILVTRRKGVIGTVIDNDKVWCNSAEQNAKDRKNIKVNASRSYEDQDKLCAALRHCMIAKLHAKGVYEDEVGQKANLN